MREINGLRSFVVDCDIQQQLHLVIRPWKVFGFVFSSAVHVLLTDDMLGKVKKWLHLSRKQQRKVNNAETFLRRIRKLVSTFPWRNKAAISSKIAGFMELENSCPIAIAFTCMTTTKVKVPHYESDFFFLYFRFFKGLPLTIWEICLDRSTRSFRLLQMVRTSIVPQSNTARYTWSTRVIIPGGWNNA